MNQPSIRRLVNAEYEKFWNKVVMTVSD